MKNEQTKWLSIVTRRLTVFRTFITAQGSRDEVRRYLGAGCDYLQITKNELSTVYLLAADTKRLSELVLARIKQNSEFPGEHAADCRRGCAALVAVSQDCAIEVTGQPVSELKEKFIRYCQEYIRFAKFMAIPVAIERTLTQRISAALAERVGAERAPEYLAKLTSSPALAEFQKEQLDLLRLAIVGGGREKLTAHANQYRWLSCYNIDEEASADDYFQGRLEELMKISKQELANQLTSADAQLGIDEQVFHATVAELGLADSLQKEIELLREYVYLRTYRVEMQSKANFYIQPLFRELARCLRMSLRLVAALSPEEIEQALDDPNHIPGKEALEARCLSRAFRYDKQGMIMLVGGEAMTLEKKELGLEVADDATEVWGTPAYKGVARGPVRVVLNKAAMGSFQTGEILVTTMTTPEFVPAMKKAAAIVTDEGGVLCHAAIVARELKVPCIIGTGRATAAFMTGDQVVVDATKGVVRKIVGQ